MSESKKLEVISGDDAPERQADENGAEIKVSRLNPAKPASFNAMEGFAAKPAAKPSSLKAESPQIPKVVPEVKQQADETTNLDNDETSQAIEDIVISESNELLAVQDAVIDSEVRPKKKKPKWYSPKALIKNKWLYFSIGLIIILIFALPYSRYKILSLFLKNQYQFALVDSTTGTPVSGATIKVDNKLLTTDGEGQASVVLPLGGYKYQISKTYYQTTLGSVFVGLAAPPPKTINIKATGRQVQIKVLNRLSNDPINNATISIQGIISKTNDKGITYIVLPTKDNAYFADVSAVNYSNVVTKVIVSSAPGVNTIGLVPSGSVYFLAQSNGKINVIKANLDGSDPQVVLAGTGSEQAGTTLLEISPDNRYLILEAQRNNGQPELYLIQTNSGNTVTEFDSSASQFNLIGWSGDQFIYDEINTAGATSTTGREQIKSYNAQNQQLNVLDQDEVNSTDASDYAYQDFINFELLPNLLIYNTQWNVTGTYDLSSANDTVRGVAPNGLNKKDYYSFAAATTGTIQAVRYQPQSIYYGVQNTSTSQIAYFNYAQGAVTAAASNVNAATLTQTYPMYYFSPSTTQTLWSTTQNNQVTIFTGDQNGQNSKQPKLPTGYSLYGWYDDLYILLDKNNQLYIAPAAGGVAPTLIGTYLANPTQQVF